MSSTLPIRDLQFEASDIGKNIKTSKRLYKWIFFLNDKLQRVELFQSLVSGKRKANLNGNMIYEDISYNPDFSYSFYIEKIFCNLIQMDSDRFELRILNRPFSVLIEEEKNRIFHEQEALEKMSNKTSVNSSSQQSKFEFPKYLKSSNRKSITQINEKSCNNFNENQKVVKSSITENIGSTSSNTRDVLLNNQKDNLINIDDVFMASSNISKVSNENKNQFDFFASPNSSNNTGSSTSNANYEKKNQFDFFASPNSSNNTGNLISNTNNFVSNSMNNFNYANNTQFNLYANINNNINLNPNQNYQKIQNEINTNNLISSNSNNKNTQIDSTPENKNVIDSFKSSSSNNKDLKTLISNSKLVDLNNLFDEIKPKKEVKPVSNSNYAFTGTPINAIKIDEQKNNNLGLNKFNSTGSNSIPFNNNPVYFNSTGYNITNQGYNNGANQGFYNNMAPNSPFNLNYNNYQNNNVNMNKNSSYNNNSNF